VPGGRTETVTAPGGLTWERTFDVAGQLVEAVDPTGLATTYTYDSAGRQASVTTGTAGTVSYGYDVVGQMVSVTDANANTTSFTYDWRGNRTSMTDAAENVWRWTYDTRGRLATEVDPLDRTTTHGWSADGRTQTTALPSGRTTSTTTNEFGQVVARTVGADAWSYAYDTAGRLTDTAGPDGTTSYSYDPAGQLVEVDGPDGVASYTWDTAGRLVERELAGAVTTYGWGATNGLLEGVSVDVDGIGDSDVAFTYDASGQRATETFDGGQRTWVRTNGRVTGYQETLGSVVVRDATVTWNGAGQIATVSDAVASTTWNLGWDPAGQLTSIDDGTTTRALTYTVLGQRATDTVTGTYSYDPAGQLVERIAPDTSVHTYSYDPDGRRSTETIDTVLAATYTWDTAGRLVEIDRGTTTTTLGHSSAGWLDTISHDNGTSIDTWNLTFDAHDPAVGLAAITDPDDTTAWTIGTGGRTTAQLTADGIDALSRDLFDTPTTPGGLDPFGDTTTAGVAADAIGYRGEVTTDGLVYLRHRHHDPTTAQFLTKDPLDGVPSTPTITNPYHHTDNNPITKTDPSGLRPVECKYDGNGCRYIVNDLMVGPQESSARSTPISHIECWQASDYRAEAVRAGNEAGVDPRMVYAIFHRESKCPRGPIIDKVAHQKWLCCGGDYPTLGPINIDLAALSVTVEKHSILWGAVPGWDPKLHAGRIGDHAWILIDTSEGHAMFAARVAAYRLSDLLGQLDKLAARYRIKMITPQQFVDKKGAEPASFFYFRSSLLGLGWFGGGEQRGGRVVEQGEYRMNQALGAQFFVKANTAREPDRCYINVYGNSFQSAVLALGIGSRTTC
jgi:RHS repeat-associated protein